MPEIAGRNKVTTGNMNTQEPGEWIGRVMGKDYHADKFDYCLVTVNQIGSKLQQGFEDTSKRYENRGEKLMILKRKKT